jgi:hypothetical protein
MTPGLADLASQIEATARAHPDYSRVVEVIRVCCDHLRAIDRINRLQHEAVASMVAEAQRLKLP